jgi:hypothetical protein
LRIDCGGSSAMRAQNIFQEFVKLSAAGAMMRTPVQPV